MGRVSSTKIVVLATCFALASIFVYWHRSAEVVSKHIPLREALSDIKGWRSDQFIPLDQEIAKALELDDYANQSYSNGHATVFLYIGYYLTAKKIGAPHSPLVCFPGQGWVISDAEEISLKIGENNIQVSRMIVTKGQKRQLVMYWFQAFDKTFSGTFIQKMYSLWAKMLYHREDNAFVRVSIPMGSQSIEEVFDTGTEFIEAFYRRFLKYVKENDM